MFRKKGHEKQYPHNEEVRIKLSDARSVLSEALPAVEKANMVLEEGEKLISGRQKYIRNNVGLIMGGLRFVLWTILS